MLQVMEGGDVYGLWRCSASDRNARRYCSCWAHLYPEHLPPLFYLDCFWVGHAGMAGILTRWWCDECPPYHDTLA